MKADFVPYGEGEPIHFDVLYEKEEYPEDLEEKDNELNAAPATRRHMLDWLAAVDQGSKPVADVLNGHISTASCILANLSMEAGRPLVYDPAQRIVVDDPEVTSMLQRDYRGPWEHPTPEEYLIK
jgi:hypothetical protein